MMKTGILAISALLSVATVAEARKYGTAGCGLGSMVFGDQKGKIQILAATTNGTAYNQTFGITSGTSNCAEDGVALKEKEKEYFASANYESLMQEMAQGQGENLQAMARLFGCGAQEFSTSMRAHYGSIFPSAETDADAMLSNVEDVVGNDAVLKQSCVETD